MAPMGLASRIAHGSLVYLGYPAVLASATALAVVLLDAGLAPGMVVAGVSLLFAALCCGLELGVPETARWRMDPVEVRADVLHAVLSNTIPTALYRAAFYGGIVALSERITAWVGTGLWPQGWPLLGQLALALLVAEAASYTIHRFLHESRLWRLHAVHHCSPRMYFLVAVRKHPLQTFITYGGRLSLLWLLGIPADVLALYTVFTAANSYVQHANLPLRTGPLGWVFATPELHRIHHSRREDELHANYGDVLIVWDWLFGTRRAPDPAAPFHREVGLPGLSVPQTYVSHLKLPFVWSRLHAGPPPG